MTHTHTHTHTLNGVLNDYGIHVINWLKFFAKRTIQLNMERKM